MTSNLWGNLAALDDVTHPITILKAQADWLAELTDRLIRGRVTQSANDATSGPFSYALEIVAPGLNFDTYTVLTLEHGRLPYPLVLHSGLFDQPLWCRDEDEYVRSLRAILASERVQRTLAVLMVQSSVLGDFREYSTAITEDELPV